MSADDVGHCSSQQALPDMSSVISSLPDKITELEYSALDKITELFLQLSYVQHFLMYDCGYRKYFRNLRAEFINRKKPALVWHHS